MRRAKRHLFCFGKKVVGVAVQYHAPNRRDGHQLLWNKFSGVEHIKAELVGLLFSKNLQAQLPLWVHTGFNAVPQITAVKIGVCAGNLYRFVPDQRVRSGFGVPVKFAKNRLARLIHQAKGMYPKAFHHAVAARYAAIRHDPHQHVC